MSIFCMFGCHSWTGCKCHRCGKIRDSGHQWNGCERRERGKSTDAQHGWDGCECTVCGRTRDVQDNWSDEECLMCGAEVSIDEVAQRWAERLKSTKDYGALAAYLCAYHTHSDGPLGYDCSVSFWNAKNRYAKEVLREAGAED